MRIALISDIHAAEAALAAVLADIERAGVDRVICLGDVATLGPRPVSVLRTLRALGCTCVMGNHDACLLDAALIHDYTEAPIILDAVDWCREQLGPDDLAFVQTFVPTAEVALGHGRTLALYHGSPRSHSEDILSTTPADTLDARARRAAIEACDNPPRDMLRQNYAAR